MRPLPLALISLALAAPALAGCVETAVTEPIEPASLPTDEGAPDASGEARSQPGATSKAPPPNEASSPVVVLPPPSLPAPAAIVSAFGKESDGATGAFWSGAIETGSDLGAVERMDPGAIQRAITTSNCYQFNCPKIEPSCTEATCDTIPFNVTIPEGFWDANEGALEVSLRWKSADPPLVLTLLDASGKSIAQNRPDNVIGSTAATVLLPKAATGAYTALVWSRWGAVSYEGVIQVDAAPKSTEVRELLPNLVTLPPTDLQIRVPPAQTVNYFPLVPAAATAPATEAVGAKGCVWDEVAFREARRCLRFSNAVGNTGEGTLEIRLAVPDGATYAAGGGFVQRVFSTDGTYTEVPAGQAEWHATHAHWHNAASNEFTVWSYDLATQSKIAKINKGNKAGICYADIGLVSLGLPHTASNLNHGYECFAPARGEEKDWGMGLSPNWYDLYPWILSDQYVEISAAKDGVYQLCSVTNQIGTIRESDLADNEACTTFRLTGDTVEILDAIPYHAYPVE